MSDIQQVKDAVKRVAPNKEKWRNVSYSEKLNYLLRMQQKMEAVVDKWGQLATKVRGWENSSFGYITGPTIGGRIINSLIETYVELVASGKPPKPQSVRQYKNKTIVTVFPGSIADKVMTGVTGELYIQEGKAPSQGQSLSEGTGKLCAILGPGNFEGPSELLYKLFIENHVVIFKPHPVNHTCTVPIYKELFEDLAKDGFCEILTSHTPEVGQALLYSDEVDEAIMTGGALTYDRIVWGDSKEEIAANKKAGKKKFSKPFAAELGACSPFIIVPGTWTPAEIAHHAELLGVSKAFNSGSICASPQVVVVDKDWPQKKEFVDALKATFSKLPFQKPYYPGAQDRTKQFQKTYTEAGCKVDVFNVNEQSCEWTLVHNAPETSYGVNNECFASALVVHEIDSKNDPATFMKDVTTFANTRPFGSLSCSVFIHPSTQQANSDAFEEMIANLEWGTVGVNEFAANSFAIGPLVWGGYFGKHTPEDIGSGVGWVNNTHMYDHVQKCVARGTWMSPSHSNLANIGNSKMMYRAAYFSIYPTYWRLTCLLSAALLGI